MKRFGRVGVAFASAIIAAFIVSAISALIQYGANAKLEGILVGVIFDAYLVVPGLILALPFVIFVDRIDGWRLWSMAAVGFLIGPATIFAIALFVKVSEDGAVFDEEHLEWWCLAAAISALTTALYLTTLKTCYSDLVQSKPPGIIGPLST
jgi:hypothetical protein